MLQEMMQNVMMHDVAQGTGAVPDMGQGLAALAHDLTHPGFAAGPAGLALHWLSEHYRFTALAPPLMEDHPELSIRVRGAFGAALARQPVPLTATGRARPHPYQVLHQPLVMIDGDEAAKPLSLRAWLSGPHLIADLTLFGWGIAWRDEAAAALLDALQSGIAIRADRRLRSPAQVIDVAHTRRAFAEVPTVKPTYAALTFRSPVTIRQGEAHHSEPRALLLAAVRRVAALARWQGCRLTGDMADWRALIARLDLATEDWHPHAWQRHSRRGGDMTIPMRGHTGRLIARGDLGDLGLILGMAEACNIGSGAALGLGWYDLVLA